MATVDGLGWNFHLCNYVIKSRIVLFSVVLQRLNKYICEHSEHRVLANVLYCTAFFLEILSKTQVHKKESNLTSVGVAHWPHFRQEILLEIDYVHVSEPGAA